MHFCSQPLRNVSDFCKSVLGERWPPIAGVRETGLKGTCDRLPELLVAFVTVSGRDEAVDARRAFVVLIGGSSTGFLGAQ